ncbi:KRAB domain-containing zinc finger protein [Mytilus galloprovincialis]|uniref:KRAB domain-containing zinc finger protein n=1 Tax=Mytilus galloprovincialis TaxID=29158 RepID=A0A8B6DIZ8_MYTGA|nr:KRAB domain-containing zinc finger protein [Mytilus galloprovincialis]
MAGSSRKRSDGTLGYTVTEEDGVKYKIHCSICGRGFMGNAGLTAHMKSHIKATVKTCLDSKPVETVEPEIVKSNIIEECLSNYQCKTCGKGFDKLCGLLSHERGHQKKIDNVGKKFECKVCKQEFKCLQYLTSHMRTHNNNYRNREKRFSCEDCGARFHGNSQLMVHKRTHNGSRPFSCNYCDKKFLNSGNCSAHVNKVHFGKAKESRYYCDVCNKGFHYKSVLKKHMMIHTEEKIYKCEYCSKTFSWKLCYDLHLKLHSGEAMHECSICQKTYPTNHILEKHMNTHTKEKEYECDICNKVFYKKGNMSKHRMIHFDNKPYKCSTCGKGFKQNSTMRTHEDIHNPEHLRKRNLCPKTFTRASGKLIHMKTVHERLRPFKCDICTKTFSNRSNLQKHLMVHNNERPHKCQQCKKAFRTRSNLKYHMDVVHVNKKTLKCLICERVFKSQGNLTIHNRMKHKDELENQNLKVSDENMNSINTRNAKTLKCYKCKKIFKTKFSYNRHMKISHGLSLAPILCLQKLDGKIKSSMQTVEGNVQKDSGILEKLKCSFFVGKNLPLKDKDSKVDAKQNCHENIFDSFLNNKKTLELPKVEICSEVGIIGIVGDGQPKREGNIFAKISHRKETMVEVMDIGEKESKPLSTDLHTNIFEKIMMKPNSNNSSAKETLSCLPEKSTNEAKVCSSQSKINNQSKFGNQLKKMNFGSLMMKKKDVGNIFSNLNGIKLVGNDFKCIPKINSDPNLPRNKTLDIESLDQANVCRNLFDDLLNDKRKSDDLAIFQNTTDDLVSNQMEHEIISIVDDAVVQDVTMLPNFNGNVNATLNMAENIEGYDNNEIDYMKKGGRNLFDELISNCNEGNKITKKKNELSGFANNGQNGSLIALHHSLENLEMQNQGHVIIVNSNNQQIILHKDELENVMNKTDIRIGSELGHNDTLQISQSTEVESNSGKTATFMMLDNCDHIDVSNLDNVNENDREISQILTVVEINEQNKIRELEDNSMHEQITEPETSKEIHMESLQDDEQCKNTDTNNLKNLHGLGESSKFGQEENLKSDDLTIFEKMEQMIKSNELCHVTEKTTEDDHTVGKKEVYECSEKSKISVDRNMSSSCSSGHDERIEDNSIQNLEVKENSCIENIDCNVQNCDKEEEINNKNAVKNYQKVKSNISKADEETVKNNREKGKNGPDEPMKESSAFNLFEKFSHFSNNHYMESDNTVVEQGNLKDHCKESENIDVEQDIPIDSGDNDNSGIQHVKKDIPIDSGDNENTGVQHVEQDNPEDSGDNENTGVQHVEQDNPEDSYDRYDSGDNENIVEEHVDQDIPIDFGDNEHYNFEDSEEVRNHEKEKDNFHEECDSQVLENVDTEIISTNEDRVVHSNVDDSRSEKTMGQESEKTKGKKLDKINGQEIEKIDSQEIEKTNDLESENLKGDQSIEHGDCKDEQNKETFSFSESIQCDEETKLASHNDEMQVEHSLPQNQPLQMNKGEIVNIDTGNTKNIPEMPRCTENDKQTEEKGCSCEDNSTNCDEMFVKKQLFSDKEKDEVGTGSIDERKEESKNLKTNEKDIQKDPVVRKRKYKGVKVIKKAPTIEDQSSVRKGNIKIIGKKLYLIGRKRTISASGESENKSAIRQDNSGKDPNKEGPITNKTEFTAYKNENTEKDIICGPEKEAQHLKSLTICDENTYTDSSEFLIEQCAKTKLVFKDGVYWCDLCDKTFKTKSSLRTHKFSHMKYNFTCQACGMGFSWEDHLERHMNVHLKTSTYIDLLQSYNA